MNTCTVICDWSAALVQICVFQQHNATRRDRHSTPKPVLDTGDTQNVVRQHFSAISELCLAYRESHWITIPKYEQDLGKEFPLSMDKIQVPSSFRCLWEKKTNSCSLKLQ